MCSGKLRPHEALGSYPSSLEEGTSVTATTNKDENWFNTHQMENLTQMCEAALTVMFFVQMKLLM